MMRLVGCVMLCCLTLAGCAPFTFVTGAGTGVIAYDRRGLNTRVRDYKLARSTRDDINEILKQDGSERVNVDVYDGIGLLTGEVSQLKTKQKAGRIFSERGDVRVVYNQIMVGPNLQASQRAYDTWLATKSKSMLLAKDGLTESTQVRVVAENNNVYLMGKVSHEEAKKAARTLSAIKGVNKVYKVFEYMK